MKVGVAAFAAAVWLVAGSAAEAVPVNYMTTGFGAVTFFPGTQQETQFDFSGCPGGFGCSTSLDLAPGVPMVAVSHGFGYRVGTNDGTFPGPDDTQVIETIFTVGAQSVALTQDVRFRQIGNGQFQLEIWDSETATLDLGALGLLDITANSFTGQVPSSRDGGAVLRATFLLREPVAAVSEPASATLLGAGLAGLGALWHRRRKRR